MWDDVRVTAITTVKDNAIMQTSPSSRQYEQAQSGISPISSATEPEIFERNGNCPESIPLTLEMLRNGLDEQTVKQLRQALNIQTFCVRLVRTRETLAKQANVTINQDAA